MTLAAPWPQFGGKSGIAAAVWERFGTPDNYVEPFFGSGAVLLLRPHAPGVETVNDADGLLVNAWRAIAADPDAVAAAADWPVAEPDLHARHWRLVSAREELTERLCADPEFFDPKLAGWWIWGACSWIGTGWCSGAGPWYSDGTRLQRRANPGRGVHRQLPHLGDPGQGVHRKLPHLGDPGEPSLTAQGVAVREWLRALRERLRRVRIACGDWSRVVTPVVTVRHGLTAVFLDPPYDAGEVDYAVGGRGVAAAVREWALANGDDPRLRIALCGHDGDHDLPGWTVLEWSARGGYGNQGGEDATDNRHRERVWFSPHCLTGQQGRLDLAPAPESR